MRRARSEENTSATSVMAVRDSAMDVEIGCDSNAESEWSGWSKVELAGEGGDGHGLEAGHAAHRLEEIKPLLKFERLGSAPPATQSSH